MNTNNAAELGTCSWAGHTFRAEATADRAHYCPRCEPVTTSANGRPWTQRSTIKWSQIKARTTATKCGSACTSAKRDKCSCECGGDNHGTAWEGAARGVLV